MGSTLYISMSLFSYVILNINTLADSLVPCDVIHKWSYCTSTYNPGTTHLRPAIRAVKSSQLLQVQRISGSRFPLSDHAFIPYPESQGRGLFYKKYNKNTLIPRESNNSTPPTINPLTVRVFHKTKFNN